MFSVLFSRLAFLSRGLLFRGTIEPGVCGYLRLEISPGLLRFLLLSLPWDRDRIVVVQLARDVVLKFSSVTNFQCYYYYYFFLRKISPELTSAANPPLFAEEDWP